MLTFLPLEQIDEMDRWEGSELNKAKEILAFELTKLVHGEEEAQKALEGAKELFASGNASQMPSVSLEAENFLEDKIDILSMLTVSGLVTSRSEGRRAVEQGGVSADGEKVDDIKATFEKERFSGDGLVLKRGKKNFKKLIYTE